MKQHVHFVGIGGIGASALAAILKTQGNTVTGSDKEDSSLLARLRAEGISVTIGHDAKIIQKSVPDLVVYSLAIPMENPELMAARKLKIPVQTYPEAVGQLTQHYYTIAICGTHGKSTITSLIAKILIENAFDPTVIVGTTLKELGNTNFRVGKSKILVLEACEYKRAFLNYNPRAIILHTLDPDHLDYYKDFNDYIDAFRQFVRCLPRDGYFFANLDDDDVHEVLKTLQSHKFPVHNTFTYSTRYPSSDFYLQGNKIIRRSAHIGELNLKIPGLHNRTNALATFSLASVLGIAPKNIVTSLNNYTGASRRFEIKGHIGNTVVIDDYAHHPVEIKATLQAACERFSQKRICVIFQPHQYSRTLHLLKEFATCFSNANMVIIPNIYEVRDSAIDKAAITPEKFVAEIKKHHRSVHFGNGFKNTAAFVKKNAKKFDAIFTMGAGDVWKIGEAVLQ